MYFLPIRMERKVLPEKCKINFQGDDNDVLETF